MALCELFSSCCKGPRGSGVGNAGGQIPIRRGGWGMAEPKSPERGNAQLAMQVKSPGKTGNATASPSNQIKTQTTHTQ